MNVLMDTLQKRVEELERENRILKQKLEISERNRVQLEETLDTHSNALKTRNRELEESRELLKASESKYRELAMHDSLTELPNRSFFNLRLDQTLDKAKERNQRAALLFMDLDLFKTINDNVGHKAGDAVLVQTAGRLLSCVRVDDFIARLGGDEFAIILSDIQDPADAENVARRVISEITKPFSVDDQPSSIGVSIGISIFPIDAMDGDRLLQYADIAMYSVKKSRTKNYQFYHNLKTSNKA